VIPFAELDPIASAAIAALLGGGLIGSVVAARKAGPEAESIAARTLIEVNEELRKELDRRDKLIDALERRLTHMREEIEGLEREVAELRP
jgi:predicted RNase H-like nuclease (RuvC/YqgF family)